MIIEFKNLQKLLHPNIVRMHEIYVDFNDGFQETSTVLIVMEKIDGKEMFEAI
jgi:calcium/calmodulin-dependent protein kinase I